MTADRDPATILESLTLPEDRRAIELWARVADLEREVERLRRERGGKMPEWALVAISAVVGLAGGMLQAWCFCGFRWPWEVERE